MSAQADTSRYASSRSTGSSGEAVPRSPISSSIARSASASSASAAARMRSVSSDAARARSRNVSVDSCGSELPTYSGSSSNSGESLSCEAFARRSRSVRTVRRRVAASAVN